MYENCLGWNITEVKSFKQEEKPREVLWMSGRSNVQSSLGYESSSFPSNANGNRQMLKGNDPRLWQTAKQNWGQSV